MHSFKEIRLDVLSSYFSQYSHYFSQNRAMPSIGATDYVFEDFEGSLDKEIEKLMLYSALIVLNGKRNHTLENVVIGEIEKILINCQVEKLLSSIPDQSPERTLFFRIFFSLVESPDFSLVKHIQDWPELVVKFGLAPLHLMRDFEVLVQKSS